jgi:GST-like protein
MIKLYSWGTPNGNKLHMMLEETGIAYELIPVNLGKGEQRAPVFLSINPNGKIPAIVDTDGPDGQEFVLAESGAILVYLADKTGQFIASNARERAMTLQWIMFQMGHVGPMIGQLHHFMSAAPPGNEYGAERYRKEGERLMDVLDNRLQASRHLAGGDYSIADIATWPWVRSWVHTTKQTLGARPSLTRWYDAIEQRPATVKAVEIYNALRNSGT